MLENLVPPTRLCSTRIRRLDGIRHRAPALPLGSLGEVEPLARQLLGETPELEIADAVRELCAAFREGGLPNSMHDDQYFNVRRLKRLKAA